MNMMQRRRTEIFYNAMQFIYTSYDFAYLMLAFIVIFILEYECDSMEEGHRTWKILRTEHFSLIYRLFSHLFFLIEQRFVKSNLSYLTCESW